MDARFWIVVVPVWVVVLANVLISLLPVPRASWARVQYWRFVRIVQPFALVLLATSLTLNFLAREPRGIFDASSGDFLTVELTLDGLAILGFVGSFLMIFARIPEAARVLHVPPRLYTWLYNRDINENLQPASSPRPSVGDDR